jgi:endonuclease/exonuclease/phosphatase family metal-dependent hydrolase
MAVQKIEFLAMDDKKRNQGAVRATLKRKLDGSELVIICTHLSSGTKRPDEEIRMKEVRVAPRRSFERKALAERGFAGTAFESELR